MKMVILYNYVINLIKLMNQTIIYNYNSPPSSIISLPEYIPIKYII